MSDTRDAPKPETMFVASRALSYDEARQIEALVQQIIELRAERDNYKARLDKVARIRAALAEPGDTDG